jgi:hypothetical protein
MIKTPPTQSQQSNQPIAARPEPLQRAPTPPPRQLTQEEAEALFEHDESLRRQLRMELRFIVNDIRRVKRFSEFLRPVDPDVYPDYFKVVTRPMDLETLLWRINSDHYGVVDEFIEDFECIVTSAEEFNEPGSGIIAKVLHFE